MNFVDIAILLIICFLGYKGYKNGLIKELGSLVALVAGIFLAIRFSDFINGLIENNIKVDTEFIPVISFAVIFIAVVIIVLVFSNVLDRFVKVIKLDWFNKIAGVLFAIIKIVLILGGLFFLILQTNNKVNIVDSSIFNKSALFCLFIDVFEFVFPYLEHLTI